MQEKEAKNLMRLENKLKSDIRTHTKISELE
jgi:hypothetical protein